MVFGFFEKWKFVVFVRCEEKRSGGKRRRLELILCRVGGFIKE